MTAKSGYAQDVMPERVDGDEAKGLAIPPSDGKGGQRGRVAPGKKVYTPGTHKVVDINTAAANLQKRSAGELPPIDGGLDGKGVSVDELPPEVAAAMHMPTQTQDFDPLSAAPTTGGGVPVIPGPNAEPYPAVPLTPGRLDLTPAAPAFDPKELAGGGDAFPPHPQTPYMTYVSKTDIETYLEARSRVTLELSEGLMAIPVIDVIHCGAGITILLPMSDDGVTFIPRPGSELTVAYRGDRWKCFFPGVHFEQPILGVIGLMFVKADEDE